MHRRPITRPLRAIGAAAALICLLVPAATRAQDAAAPVIAGKPAITGTPQVGETLAAIATWTGDPAPDPTWAWQRCDKAAGTCSKIAGAKSDRYVVTAADVGTQLRVRLVVTNTAGSDDKRSDVTGVVQALPQPPGPAPTPTPTPTPGSAPAPIPHPATTAVSAASPPALLDPFPVLRLRGSLTQTGARIDLFTIRVPAHVLVAVRCRGSSCRAQRFERRTSTRQTIRLRRFEGRVRAGTQLSVKVTRAGRIGKWTTILIRRGAAPRRSDLCAYPAAGAPAPCPT